MQRQITGYVIQPSGETTINLPKSAKFNGTT